MAKWGEGDPRWIVEERPDATNVNNWHWYVVRLNCASCRISLRQRFDFNKVYRHIRLSSVDIVCTLFNT